jgi:hypothetical protein
MYLLGLPFFILAKMDALSAKGCITAFKAMGGVDVHIILPLPKYFRNGQLVACEKTAIFVGNIPARKGKRDGFASIFCSESNEELSESLSATASADEMETEVDGGSIDSKGNVPDLIVQAPEEAEF